MSTREYATWMIGCVGSVLLLNAAFGAWSINVLLALFDATIPLWQAVVAGLVLGQFTIPLAVVVWVLRSAGVI